MSRDLVFGALGALAAVGYYVMAAGIRESALADAVGPQGLPKVYAGILLLLSLMLVVRSLRHRTPDPGSRIPALPLRRVLGTLALGAAYIVLVPWLGYVVTLAGLIFAATWYQGGIASRTIAVVAVAGAVVLWLLFVVLLGIPHPAGVWARLF